MGDHGSKPFVTIRATQGMNLGPQIPEMYPRHWARFFGGGRKCLVLSGTFWCEFNSWFSILFTFMEVKHLIGLSLYFQFTENQVSSASNWHLFLIALVDKNNLYINSMQLARAFTVTCEFPPLGTKLLDSWKNAVRGEFRRCGCGKQHGAQRKVIGWLPKFYCTEFMVHFLTLCFPFWLYAPVKNQVFGCLLPEVCLYSAVQCCREDQGYV